MSTSTKPATAAPTSLKSGTSVTPSNSDAARNQFYAAALSMSWQLALVVLVPLLGGFKLDQHLHSLPLWTGLGFAVAMVGMVLVVRRQLQLFDPTVTKANIENARKIREAEHDDD